jgi:hypothetical protein
VPVLIDTGTPLELSMSHRISHPRRTPDEAPAQQAVVDFLSTPAAYGDGTGTVERIDTHISVVFLTGQRAFKLKRAVRFDYLDFSTPSTG